MDYHLKLHIIIIIIIHVSYVMLFNVHTTLFMVNIVDHTINEEPHTKNIMNIIMDTY